MNLFTALRAGFPADLDATAIDADGALYSWRDLERGSAMLANWLAKLDLPAGSRVAVHTDKSVEALILYLAVLRAGLVYLPLNPAYQASELEHFISDAAPGVVVCAGKNFGWVSKLAFQRGVRWVFTLNDDRSGTLLDRAVQMSDQHEPVPRAAGDLAAILYTSGTTGRSKGAMLSHGNLLSNAQTLKTFWDWQPNDVLLHALPIFHVHGLFVASHGALLNGSKMIWFNKFDAGAVARRLPEATVFMGVPTLYVRLLQERTLDTRNIRLFISGSAPLLIETWQAWQARTGHLILERYGMSETLMLTSNPCKPEDGQRIGGTVGRALPGVSLRIVGDDGQPCAVDEIGNVQVRGPNVFSGYWQMPEKTAEEFTPDGWFKTGDVGRVDARGYLTLIGRSKDLIISGGFNVYPAEIEGFLNELPGVGESAVIGVPHPDFGEAVVAVVTPRGGALPDPDGLIAALKSRIASFKVPKRILVAPELPRNAMGKVQKKLLREQQAGLFTGK
ncbi:MULTISPECIES: malonyl-CoA synthase [unclassified Roseateles]|uniref:malonate--CoA ligase n=1 Tax=unclassified Roseateles TaxID=2626991 RepID=UPI0006F878AC|nr:MULTISPECIES: malonyl-CoA synthase [unclassified Roseateles]KQW51508.1 malonyl-CoA synthase [Pelomonas sp. Root405]KRA77741.1 malonyl-CoA synthase [Pelomonas sp. Root662]